MKASSITLLLLRAGLPPAVAQESIVGQASVIDGDTVEIRGIRISLFGVDAPESDQTCHDDNGKLYRCGQQAAIALSNFGAKAASCALRDIDRYGRTVAVCSVAGVEIADWLVRGDRAFD